MNKTVELVKVWGAFEEQNPGATLEDFYRFQIAQSPRDEPYFTEANGKLIPDLAGRFIILVRRIGKFHIFFSNKGLEGTGLGQVEEFGLLVTIFNMGSPIKSETIQSNIMELSSGSNMLIRLKKKGFVNEFSDKDDKRVRRLKLTAKGEDVLKNAVAIVQQAAHLLADGMSEEEMQSCIELLKPIDARISDIYQKHKNKPLDEIFPKKILKK
ncbi:winged helix DNA-binding protein [Mucilaginibacter sp. cycad4]|uniref:MarR family winged helix-turn-helix transcriptional regulator n=1 Tax=Mucilaginibacter sp. cycad4 TaxID=3342096 RepID=UPI002AAAAEDC|nr:winged helix DNA-binding protein [Mucilaginibacter gossypii]WPU97809.1 winged helix DNA-binding protein [Mucilaginibacter gossypii]